jgi:hypothetical protein
MKDSSESSFVDLYANDIVLDGNLTVGGTTTTVNTSNVLIEDPILQLAKGQTSGTPTVDIGFLGLRGSSQNAGFIWDESDDVFAAILTTSDGSGTTLTPASYAGFKAGNVSLIGSGGDVKLTLDRTDKRTYSIYTESNNHFRIRDEDASADRFTITSAGHVGIGITPKSAWSGGVAMQVGDGIALFSPTGTDELDLTANTYFDGSNWKRISNNYTQRYEQTNGQHIWYSAGANTGDTTITWSEQMRIDAAGKVGIGTTPATPLHVNKATGGTDIRISASNYSAGTFGEIGIDSAALHLRAGGQNNGISILHSNRNVGIGTTAPSEVLHVVGKIKSTSNWISGSYEFANGVLYGGTLQLRGAASSSATVGTTQGDLFLTANIQDSSNYNVKISPSGTGVSYFSTGNVGIGTAAPGAKLEIQGDSSARALLTVGASTTAAVGYFYTNAIHTGVDTSSIVSIRSDHASSTGKVLHVRGDGSGNLLTLDQGGTDRLVVQADGTVGIDVVPSNWGSSSDFRGLQIGTGGVVYGRGSGDGAKVGLLANAFRDNVADRFEYITTSYASAYEQTDGYHQFRTAASGTANNAITWSTSMTIDRAGNVGIGTTAPVSPLHVKGTSNTNIITIGVGHADGSVRSHWGYDSSGATMGFIVGSAYAHDSAKFQIRMKGTASSDAKVTVQGDGNVGIGTTAPAAPLHVLQTSGDDNDTGLIVETTNSAERARILLRQGSSIEDFIFNLNSTGMHFGFSSSTQQFNINSSGCVGIGTISPGGLLHVYGSNSSAGDLWTQVGTGNAPNITIQNASATDNTNAALFFKNDSVYVGSIGMRFTNHSSDAAQMRFSTTSGGTTRERMTLDESGKLGIGTSTPDTNLQIVDPTINSKDILHLKTSADSVGD